MEGDAGGHLDQGLLGSPWMVLMSPTSNQSPSWLAGPRPLPYVGHIGRDVENPALDQIHPLFEGWGHWSSYFDLGKKTGDAAWYQNWTQIAEDTMHFYLLNK